MELEVDDLHCNATNLTAVPESALYAAIVSSVASIIGSGLIILTFAIWADIRTPARAILVFLAIADLFTAIGYLFASILFKVNPNVSPDLCTLQSFITTVFPISSFLWTGCLAIYLFVSISLKKSKVAKKMIILFHIIAWGIPLLLCIPGAATGVLGRKNNTLGATQGTVGWCWVSFDNDYNINTTDGEIIARLNKLHALELLFGKFWEISVFFLAIILCVVVKISIYKKRKAAERDSTLYGSSVNADKVKAALTHLDQKLIWIPIVFILFRGWSTFRWIIAILDPYCYQFDRECSLHYERAWLHLNCVETVYNKFLVFMQALGDPGQGWGNALLYVFFHPVIARRLFPCVFVCFAKLRACCLNTIRRKEYSSLDPDTPVAMSYSVTENSEALVHVKKPDSEYKPLTEDLNSTKKEF